MSYFRIFENSIKISKRYRVSYFRIFMHIDACELSPSLNFCLIVEYPRNEWATKLGNIFSILKTQIHFGERWCKKQSRESNHQRFREVEITQEKTCWTQEKTCWSKQRNIQEEIWNRKNKVELLQQQLQAAENKIKQQKIKMEKMNYIIHDHKRTSST